jgi:hypothetical protein
MMISHMIHMSFWSVRERRKGMMRKRMRMMMRRGVQ